MLEAIEKGALRRTGQIRNYRLGMAQLAPEGLSEQWLLRECGDIHWLLLAQAIGLNRAVFVDDEGRPAYAAFCATSLDLLHPAASLPGADVIVTSDIFRVGLGSTGSVHVVCREGVELARLRMISTFVSHDSTGLNRRIVRNRAVSEAELPGAPEGLVELNESARRISKSYAGPPARAGRRYRETPCPSLDFNAVGLLYFPVFSRLAERAQWVGQQRLAPLARRVVVYLGNLDWGDSVEVVEIPSGLGIYRDDAQLIAHVATLRHERAFTSAVIGAHPANALSLS
ncbi:Pnap_2097 family protein [Nitratireductor sp. ZSWI3]|uniref:Pnap_2097 family protein n=1 Tax=Nitratireductor sp. ZSWI3 TaxID=2966359 RepID=UPI00214FA956|nr:Pnap_2097 family protein [Nitratireductor sp. ZSWI3]MCR4265176.1 hypothetical protein [Nitratireductor sp. ZSWI3]